MLKMNMKKTIASILAATMAVAMLSTTVSAIRAKHTWTDKYGYEHVHYCDTVEECKKLKAAEVAEVEAMLGIDSVAEARNSKLPAGYTIEDKVDKIGKMKYYGKAITSAPITSDAKLCAAIQYGAAQGATKITLKYAGSYTDAKKKAWREYHEEVWGNEILTLNSGAVGINGTNYKHRELALYVYAYRYGHSDLIKKEDKKMQEIYNKCVKILKECGVNDKNKSDMEKISAILNWLNSNVKYGLHASTGETTFHKYYMAYNPIVLGKGKCYDYSQAFQLLTRMAGYKSWYIEGTATWGGSTGEHAWNAIRINGELRFVEPQRTDRIMTYSELSKYGYKSTMTEKKLEMYCKY